MRRFRTRGSSSHHSSPVVLICLLLLPGYTCCQVFFAIQRLIDHRIYRTEGFLADDMPVVVRPTSNHRVEFLYQFPSRQPFVGLHDRSDFLKECFHILLGWGNEQLVPFARLVLTYVLTEEVEPILDMRDEGLLC